VWTANHRATGLHRSFTQPWLNFEKTFHSFCTRWAIPLFVLTTTLQAGLAIGSEVDFRVLPGDPLAPAPFRQAGSSVRGLVDASAEVAAIS